MESCNPASSHFFVRMFSSYIPYQLYLNNTEHSKIFNCQKNGFGKRVLFSGRVTACDLQNIKLNQLSDMFSYTLGHEDSTGSQISSSDNAL